MKLSLFLDHGSREIIFKINIYSSVSVIVSGGYFVLGKPTRKMSEKLFKNFTSGLGEFLFFSSGGLFVKQSRAI